MSDKGSKTVPIKRLKGRQQGKVSWGRGQKEKDGGHTNEGACQKKDQGTNGTGGDWDPQSTDRGRTEERERGQH